MTRRARPGLLRRLRQKAEKLNAELAALSLCARDKRTPLAAKIVVVATVAYALSPIDLIPDFIPVLGLLDDLVLVPLGITLAIRLIPPKVLADNRRRAARNRLRLKKNPVAAVVVICIWALVLFWIGKTLSGLFKPAVAPP